jgi:hypothetical protein
VNRVMHIAGTGTSWIAQNAFLTCVAIEPAAAASGSLQGGAIACAPLPS